VSAASWPSLSCGTVGKCKHPQKEPAEPFTPFATLAGAEEDLADEAAISPGRAEAEAVAALTAGFHEALLRSLARASR
jgi:hypothetical protein